MSEPTSPREPGGRAYGPGEDRPPEEKQRQEGEQAGDAAGKAGHDAAEHDPTGFDLARRIAGSVAAGNRTRRRRARRSRPGPQVSGARPDDRDPKPLGTTVEHLMSDRGWTKELTVHVLLGRWAALVGPVNAQHTSPESFTDGVITVRADSTAWATQLRQLAPALVARLNEQLGDGTVRRITVRGPTGPSWKKGRLSTPDGRGPRDTYG